MSISVEDLNLLNKAAFIQEIGFVFEHSPWVAEQAWSLLPFSSVSDLHETMVNIVDQAEINKKMNLLKAHPDLSAKVKMTSQSVIEQSGAGLDQLSREESQEFLELNQAYRGKFDFPFIVAVRENNKDSIKTAMEKRLTNDYETEFQTALREIYKIARFRLDDLFSR